MSLVAVIPEELNLAARRVSLAPANRANMQGRSLSWRNGSVHWSRGMEGRHPETATVNKLMISRSELCNTLCKVFSKFKLNYHKDQNSISYFIASHNL